MSRSLTSLIGALVATTAAAWSGQALAEAVGVGAIATLGAGYSAADAPLGEAQELRVDLKGRVEARCNVAPPPSGIGGLDLVRAGERSTQFVIDCNAPFSLRVVSQHGGFASAVPLPGVDQLKPYEISVDVGTDQGRRDLGWCESSALTIEGGGDCTFAPTSASRGWSSGDAVAIKQTGALRLRWDEQTADQILLGAYADTIVIQLEVRS